jgi:hypothetical protein
LRLYEEKRLSKQQPARIILVHYFSYRTVLTHHERAIGPPNQHISLQNSPNALVLRTCGACIKNWQGYC